MRSFYKIVHDGYIEGFGTNGGDNAAEITEAEYNELNEFFKTMPKAPAGKMYRMKDKPLEWVLADSPYEDPDVDDAEALSILLGGVGE